MIQSKKESILTAIAGLPEVYDGVHESMYKSYHILQRILIMLERGDSRETILEEVDMFIHTKMEEEKAFKPEPLSNPDTVKIIDDKEPLPF